MMQAETKPYKRIGMGFLVLAGLCLVLSFMVLLNDGQGRLQRYGPAFGQGIDPLALRKRLKCRPLGERMDYFAIAIFFQAYGEF
jgi:hypothetical protein